MKTKKIIMLLGLLLIGVFLIGCDETATPGPGSSGTDTVSTGDGELKQFSSIEEMKTFLQESGDSGSGYYGGGFGIRNTAVAMDMAVEESFESAAPKTAQSGGFDGADDFSTTNVQVEGVDEADFVKNDGKYIYVLTGNKIVIVDAFPADDAEILSEIEIEGNAQEFFINDDKLIVFGTNYRHFRPVPIPRIGGVDMPEIDDDSEEKLSEVERLVPFPDYTNQYAFAYIYDISDREEPEEDEKIVLRGRYHDSRMIGDIVYMITNEYARFYNDIRPPCVYSIKDGDVTEKCIQAPDMYYFDYPDSFEFSTVMAIDMEDNSHEEKTVLKGTSQNLYVSENNIYITFQKRIPYYEQQTRIIKEVYLPVMPENMQDKVKSIMDLDISDRAKNVEIEYLLERWMYSMSNKERGELQEKLEDKMEEIQIKIQVEQSKTLIQKIEIDGMDINPSSSGEVPGTVLNQFSMDEHDGNFRIATTVRLYLRSGTEMYNNVYVLDEDLDIIGEIEDIAPDERIYSARFMGDRLYMVTFKNIDPFFVIDLSDPEDPSVLGELKIPGFSDYLHPFDEDHIIGVGKETEGNEWGGVSTKGVKVALFDVSDVTDPVLVDKVEIGQAGSDSEALRDHKAFFFSKGHDLMVLPVREVTKRIKDPVYGYYRNEVWHGAHAFTVTEEGFKKRGEITHDGDEVEDRYYWGSQYAVRRTLFMDDVLYTISNAKIKMNDIDSIDEINSIELPREEYDKPVPYKGIVMEEPMVEIVEADIDEEVDGN